MVYTVVVPVANVLLRILARRGMMKEDREDLLSGVMKRVQRAGRDMGCGGLRGCVKHVKRVLHGPRLPLDVGQEKRQIGQLICTMVESFNRCSVSDILKPCVITPSYFDI